MRKGILYRVLLIFFIVWESCRLEVIDLGSLKDRGRQTRFTIHLNIRLRGQGSNIKRTWQKKTTNDFLYLKRAKTAKGGNEWKRNNEEKELKKDRNGTDTFDTFDTLILLCAGVRGLHSNSSHCKLGSNRRNNYKTRIKKFTSNCYFESECFNDNISKNIRDEEFFEKIKIILTDMKPIERLKLFEL